MKRLVTVLTALALPCSLLAQAPAALPTGIPTSVTSHSWKARDVALSVGGLILLSGLLDNSVHLESQNLRGVVSDRVAAIGNEFGNGRRVLPLLGAAWLIGTATGSERVQDVAGHTLQAGLTAGLAATTLKFLTGRDRPNGGSDADHFSPFRTGDTSFPSGHTALAFGIATALANEFEGTWDDIGLYGLATLTGLSRINDNKHWLSDVLGGAAVGVLAGRWATRSHRQLPITVGPSGIGFSFSF
jgi:membrane-associated phospholipid phosphatase